VPIDADFAAPPLEFTHMDGGRGSLAAFRGKVLLVNLWATWCPQCLAEMPVLESAARDFAGQGLVVLAIDEGETPDMVREFVRRRSLNLDVVLDPQEEAMRLLRTTALPSSYLVDEKGQVRVMWFGAIDRAHLEAALARVLNTGGVP
jgi:thiol-disulfide isomerase/thioredoxin